MSNRKNTRLVFVIPVRHHQSVGDWLAIKQNLKETAASIANQTDPNWQCIVVANTGADLPEFPDGFRVCHVDFPKPVMPDRVREEEAYYETVRLDKGKRILQGMAEAEDEDYVMVVDFDDWVSQNLSAWVQRYAGSPGWYFPLGYFYDFSRYTYLHEEFSEYCGTSHIIRKDLYGLANPDEATSETIIRRNLGSHIHLRHDLENSENPLTKLPFPGAVYRIDTSNSTSGTPGIQGHFFPRWMLKRKPREFLRRLSRLRPMTNKIRAEFNIGPPLQG